MNRIEQLDWLRGLMAFSVMIYHYLSWSFGAFESDSIWGRLGIYTISTFYILSGLSLAIVYNYKINNIKDIYDFTMRRLFRILPVMWIATTYMLFQVDLNFIPTTTIIMNFTATFGFINPSAYLMTGGWSIGNEMVFYALFPLILFIYCKSIKWGNVITIISIIIEVLFLRFFLTNEADFSSQWAMYINPFNQLYLFVIGIFIYFNFKNQKISLRFAYFITVIGVIVFCFYPITGNMINLVTGFNRFILSLSCILVVFAFYKGSFIIKNKTLNATLNNLGIASYSVYILHPIIFDEIKKLFINLGITSPVILITTSVLITLVVSWIIYKIYEVPFVKLGKRFTSKKRGNVLKENLNYYGSK